MRLSIRNPHIVRAMSRPIDGRALQAFDDNREIAFAMSAGTRNGRVPNPPVRRDRALVPFKAAPINAADPSPLGQGLVGVAPSIGAEE